MSSGKVLVIEDDQSINLLIKENLSSEKYDVISAFDGEEGLSAALKHVPDLIILDILLPRLNGWELYKKLRTSSSKARGAPVIVVSVVSRESKPENPEPGPLSFMSKPFDVKILVNEVKRIIQEHRKS